MAIKLERYTSLIRNVSEFENIRIKAYIPRPTEGDYNVGYINRYFTQKGNDIKSYIFEINQSQYESLTSNPFYKTIQLNWKISGDVNDVKTMNTKSIIFASANMETISLYLPNLLQFHK
jgi:hypothetical protein